MNLFSGLNNMLKMHGYSIATAVVIALLIGGYITFVIPENEKIEDKVNFEYFGTIEKQFKAYIDDQVNEINANNLKQHKQLDSKQYYIDSLAVDNVCTVNNSKQTISINRTIYFKSNSDNPATDKKVALIKPVTIDFRKFLDRINASTDFNAYYMCLVKKDRTCDTDQTLMSKNINLNDRDSLSTYCKSSTSLNFKGSKYRYYANQVTIPGTDTVVFIAAGMDKLKFEKNVRAIRSDLLIFSLMIAIILLLSISFIKPVISSFKERVSQMDLMTAIFSLGTLTAVLVVFGLVCYWDSAIKARNDRDLEKLVNYIDHSFSDQITRLASLREHQVLGNTDKSNSRFHKLYRDTAKAVESGTSKLLPIDPKLVARKRSDDLKYLDSYFRMDENGLITDFITKDDIGYRRKFNDRTYFKELQDAGIHKFLIGVLSRENDQYQWIYSETEDQIQKKGSSAKKAIKGIAFRQSFTKDIALSPDTDYMIIDGRGNVLMHKDSTKNLYQNLFTGSEKDSRLRTVEKTGNSFEMEYQGKSHQVFIKKLTYGLDAPIYILGMRNLTHMHYLSVFTFVNAILIAVGYGFFILLLTLFYSVLFYKNRIPVFSWEHFHYLFPDNSRRAEYTMLQWVNSAVIAIVIGISLLTSPSTALVCCLVLGVNSALFNFIVLNIHTEKKIKAFFPQIAIFIIMGIIVPLVLLFFNQPFLSCIILIATQFSFIYHCRNWRNWKNDFEDIREFAKRNNNGVIRKVYSRCQTSILIHFFAVFPMILACALYASEINDYARYYCSSLLEEKDPKENKIEIYGCQCDGKITEPFALCLANDSIVQRVGFLERPTFSEIKKFKFTNLSQKKYYLNSEILYKEQLCFLFVLLCGLSLLVLLVYALVNYYGNRFFFYDLMQACYRGYYPCQKHPLSNDAIFLSMVSDEEVQNYLQHENPQTIAAIECTNRTIAIEEIFKAKAQTKSDEDLTAQSVKIPAENEIPPVLQIEFFNNHNQNKYEDVYLKVFIDLPDEARKVLFDFAPDNFVNYKNKEILMYLMDIGIVVHDQLTGRLRLMSPGFRNFMTSLNKKDVELITSFLATVEDDSKNGTYGKMKVPLLILAGSLLLLLMYIKRDSHEQVLVAGGSIATIWGLLNKLMTFSKVD